MKKVFRNVVIFCIILFTGCAKDTAVTVIRPTISTILPYDITSNGATLRGYFSEYGDYSITDCGFVWSTTPVPTLESEGKISLGPPKARGEYDIAISGLEEGTTYYVRAYITDELGTVYDGDATTTDQKDFIGKVFSTTSLAVYNFHPTSGKSGDLITIGGDNFSLIPSENKVEFGGQTAVVSSVTATSIDVIVPSNITERSINIYITVHNKTAVSYDKFMLMSGEWSGITDFEGTARKFATSFTIGGKAYVLTGSSNNGTFDNYTWEFDPANNSWTRKSDFPGEGRNNAVAFELNGKGYIGTGENTGKLNDFWQYDPSSDAWTRKSDFKGTPRAGAIGFSFNGSGYIGLGNDGTILSDMWIYDPGTDNWNQINDFPSKGRYGAISFVTEDQVFIGTGLTGSGVINDLWAFQPLNESWTQKENMPGSARYFASAFYVKGKAYIGLGFSTKELSDFWEYDLSTGTWLESAGFNGGARYGSIGFSDGTNGFIGLGVTNNILKKDFWKFNIE